MKKNLVGLNPFQGYFLILAEDIIRGTRLRAESLNPFQGYFLILAN